MAALLDVLQHGKDPNARRFVAAYLGVGEVQREAVVRALIRAMRDPDEDVRLQAVKALGGLGPPARAALPQLWERARTGASEEWRDEALRAVALITRDWRKVGPLLLRLQGEDKAGDRLDYVLNGLVLVAPQVEGFCVDLLQSREQDRRRLAFRILDRTSPPSEQLVPALVEVLSDTDRTMRCRAAIALGEIGPAARVAVPVLLPLLKGKEKTERRAAVYALARIGPYGKKARALLLAALDEEEMRAGAVVALARMGAEARPAVPQLVAALEDEDPLVRCGAAWALARMGAEARPAVPRLVAALEDKDPLVRCGAAWALGNLGPEAASATEALVMMLHSPDEFLQASTARALGRIGPRARAAVPTLRALSTDPRIAVRRRIYGNSFGSWVRGYSLDTLLPEDGLDAYAEARKALAKIGPGPAKETPRPRARPTSPP
jgi:HEAT repeat protein